MLRLFIFSCQILGLCTMCIWYTGFYAGARGQDKRRPTGMPIGRKPLQLRGLFKSRRLVPKRRRNGELKLIRLSFQARFIYILHCFIRVSPDDSPQVEIAQSTIENTTETRPISIERDAGAGQEHRHTLWVSLTNKRKEEYDGLVKVNECFYL